MFFKFCAMELILERCIVSLLDRVVEVKKTYILLFSEIQCPKGHLNYFLQNTNRGRGIIFNDNDEGFKFTIISFIFLLGSVETGFFKSMFLIFFH